MEQLFKEAMESIYIQYVNGTLNENDRAFVEKNFVETGVFKEMLLADGDDD